MLTLYYRPTCPFCQRVLGAAEEIGVSFNLKDVGSDETLREELIHIGGKRQVPFLVDEDRGVSLYESSEIIAYLEEQYAAQPPRTHSGLRVHQSDAACEVCE